MTCFVLMKPGCLQAQGRHGWRNRCLSLRTATRVASGRSLKRHSPKVEAEFMGLRELRLSFKSHLQPLIPRSRNCKSVRAISNSTRTVYPLRQSIGSPKDTILEFVDHTEADVLIIGRSSPTRSAGRLTDLTYAIVEGFSLFRSERIGQ